MPRRKKKMEVNSILSDSFLCLVPFFCNCWICFVLLGFLSAEMKKGVTKLFETVIETKRKADMYEAVLESMKSTLEPLIQIAAEIKQLNKTLECGDDGTENLWEQLQRGKELLHKCSKSNDGCFSCFKRANYTDELQRLDDAIRTFCQTVLQAQQVRNQKKILEEVKTINEKVTDTQELLGGTYFKLTDIQEDINKTREGVKSTQEEVKDMSEHVKDISEEVKVVKEIDDKVKDIQSEVKVVKNIDDKVVDIQDKMMDIHKGAEQVKQVQEKVEDIHEGVKEVKDLLKEIKSQNGKPPTALNNNGSLHPPEPPEVTVGLDGPLRELKKELFKDDVSIMVLSAPGGYGKTTLAKKLCQDDQVKEKFKENIFFVTVTKTPNLKVIVQQLFQHKGYEVPDIRSDEEAVNRLGQFIKKIGPNPVLLILDDVWFGSDSFLDKFKIPKQGYKILVTSRSSFPRFKCEHKLEKLNFEDSLRLFRHSACLEDGSSESVDESVVHQAVKACKGLPLALTVLGRSLCGQHAEIWQKRVTEWSKGGIFKSNVDLLNNLTSSLDVLNNEVKECYMDLGSFPEGQWIPATALIDIWSELYKVERDDRDYIANLHEMSNMNLVDILEVACYSLASTGMPMPSLETGYFPFFRKDAGDAEGYYDEHFVMQHSLLRELVNHLSGVDPIEKRTRIILDITGNDFPEWWREQKEQPLSANLLSISTDEKFSSMWCNMQAPKVKTLILNFRSKIYCLPVFLVNMNKVKALIITKYGFSPAEMRSTQFLDYLPNLRRIRLEQVLIPSLNLTSVPLVKLQKISLIRCTVGPAFGNSVQISAKYPNLVEINIGNCTHLEELPVGICGISKLKKLSITYCDSLRMLPKEIGKLEHLEVLRLRSCANLSELPETVGSLSKLKILDISDCHSLRELPERIVGMRIRKMPSRGCTIANLANLDAA